MPLWRRPFGGLLRPLLSKPRQSWANGAMLLREALDPNGQLIVDLVPELKLIIGEQAPVPEFPPQDAQGPLSSWCFRRLSAYSRGRKHPLALFLDDLQWLDAATLDLLEDLLTRPDVQNLILIGAYRDNEVDSAHPLMRKLQAIRQLGRPCRRSCLYRWRVKTWSGCLWIPFTANRSASHRWRNWSMRKLQAIHFSPFSLFLPLRRRWFACLRS